MSSLLSISVANVKIDLVLAKMAKTYKPAKQSVKEALGTVRQEAPTQKINERAEQQEFVQSSEVHL